MEGTKRKTFEADEDLVVVMEAALQKLAGFIFNSRALYTTLHDAYTALLAAQCLTTAKKKATPGRVRIARKIAPRGV